MDFMSESYEFLDLSDIDDSERKEIIKTLYSKSQAINTQSSSQQSSLSEVNNTIPNLKNQSIDNNNLTHDRKPISKAKRNNLLHGPTLSTIVSPPPATTEQASVESNDVQNVSRQLSNDGIIKYTRNIATTCNISNTNSSSINQVHQVQRNEKTLQSGGHVRIIPRILLPIRLPICGLSKSTLLPLLPPILPANSEVKNHSEQQKINKSTQIPSSGITPNTNIAGSTEAMANNHSASNHQIQSGQQQSPHPSLVQTNNNGIRQYHHPNLAPNHHGYNTIQQSNVFVPTHTQQIFPTIIPAGYPSNVYNIHGWATHPSHATLIPANAQHFMAGGDVQQNSVEQNNQSIQTIHPVPVPLPINSQVRPYRRGRGRGGNNGGRRSEYTHRNQQGNAGPQEFVATEVEPTYPPFSYQQTYSTFYQGPPQSMGQRQNQQATGPIFVASPIPVFSSPPIYNYHHGSVIYPPVMHADYHNIVCEENGDERTAHCEPVMWPLYSEDYVNPELMSPHDEIISNAPVSLISTDTQTEATIYLYDQHTQNIYDPQTGDKLIEKNGSSVEELKLTTDYNTQINTSDQNQTLVLSASNPPNIDENHERSVTAPNKSINGLDNNNANQRTTIETQTNDDNLINIADNTFTNSTTNDNRTIVKPDCVQSNNETNLEEINLIPQNDENKLSVVVDDNIPNVEICVNQIQPKVSSHELITEQQLHLQNEDLSNTCLNEKKELNQLKNSKDLQNISVNTNISSVKTVPAKTKTMMWTNTQSTPVKKSTSTVAVTAAPNLSNKFSSTGQQIKELPNSLSTSINSPSNEIPNNVTCNDIERKLSNVDLKSVSMASIGSTVVPQQLQQQKSDIEISEEQSKICEQSKPDPPKSEKPKPEQQKVDQKSEGKQNQKQNQRAMKHQKSSHHKSQKQLRQQRQIPPPQTPQVDNKATAVVTENRPKPKKEDNTSLSPPSLPSKGSPTTVSATQAQAQPVQPAPPPVSVPWASLFDAKNTVTYTTSQSSTSVSSTTNSSSSSSLKKTGAKISAIEGQIPNSKNGKVSTVTKPGVLSYSATSAQGIPLSQPKKGGKIATQIITNTKIISTSDGVDDWPSKFLNYLLKWETEYSKPVSLRPRGLTNRSNYCYINSILQALMGCAPFYNLLKSIPIPKAIFATNSDIKIPTISALVQFASEFSLLTDSNKTRDDIPEIKCDCAFEPNEIYKLWNATRTDNEGRQEDAEEFLGYVLNKLNDELLEAINFVKKPTAPVQPPPEPQTAEVDDTGEDWQIIYSNKGGSNRATVLRQTDFGKTPLSDIFRGELRSRLQKEGSHSTVVIQPFYTLQLNIEKSASVKEALEILVGRDQLEGVTCSKTNQEVVAWQQITIEKLPVILILHLKWFDYKSNGCSKILKTVEFPVDLKLDTKTLGSKKYNAKQRSYRLFAVVYHDGKEATKGHYITDVYHTKYARWLRYDDSSVKPVDLSSVLRPRAPRVPYLLYYQRTDTIRTDATMK